MTEREIKQRADGYARDVDAFAEDECIYLAARDGYTSGAHACNEEVKKLQGRIRGLESSYSRLLEKYNEAKAKIKNPWINSDEQSPEMGDTVLAKFIANKQVDYVTFEVNDFYLRGKGKDKKLYFKIWECPQWQLLGKKKEKKKKQG